MMHIHYSMFNVKFLVSVRFLIKGFTFIFLYNTFHLRFREIIQKLI